VADNFRVKLDYNHLMQQILDFLDENSTEENERLAFGIGVGLNLLNSYIKNIADRVIELNDDVLIGLLKDLDILTDKKQSDCMDNEEKKNNERYRHS